MVDISNKELEGLREQIDIIDRQILRLLEKRFEIVNKVAECKRKNNLPIRDLSREEDVINSKCNLTNLSKDTVKKIYRLLIDESIKMERVR